MGFGRFTRKVQAEAVVGIRFAIGRAGMYSPRGPASFRSCSRRTRRTFQTRGKAPAADSSPPLRNNSDRMDFQSVLLARVLLRIVILKVVAYDHTFVKLSKAPRGPKSSSIRHCPCGVACRRDDAFDHQHFLHGADSLRHLQNSR